jgi:hypothetical protein
MDFLKIKLKREGNLPKTKIIQSELFLYPEYYRLVSKSSLKRFKLTFAGTFSPSPLPGKPIPPTEINCGGVQGCSSCMVIQRSICVKFSDFIDFGPSAIISCIKYMWGRAPTLTYSDNIVF